MEIMVNDNNYTLKGSYNLNSRFTVEEVEFYLTGNRGKRMPLLFYPSRYPDKRGSFCEVFNFADMINATRSEFSDNKLSISPEDPKFSSFLEEFRNGIVQTNVATNREKKTWRGLHINFPVVSNQAKIVTCLSGSILDVIVDMDINSETFGEYTWAILDSRVQNSLYVPSTFAHGYLTLEDETTVLYNCNLPYYDDDINDLRAARKTPSSLLYNRIDYDIDFPVKEKNDSRKFEISHHSISLHSSHITINLYKILSICKEWNINDETKKNIEDILSMYNLEENITYDNLITSQKDIKGEDIEGVFPYIGIVPKKFDVLHEKNQKELLNSLYVNTINNGFTKSKTKKNKEVVKDQDMDIKDKISKLEEMFKKASEDNSDILNTLYAGLEEIKNIVADM